MAHLGLVMSVLHLHDVTKTYDQVLVLRDLFFRLGEGDRVGLVARNGTGKTTMLRLILGRHEPTRGEVLQQLEAALRQEPDSTVMES